MTSRDLAWRIPHIRDVSEKQFLVSSRSKVPSRKQIQAVRSILARAIEFLPGAYSGIEANQAAVREHIERARNILDDGSNGA